MPLQPSLYTRSRSGHHGFPACPHCGDTPFVAEAAEFVSEWIVRHSFACDVCGHGFRETVRIAEIFHRPSPPLAPHA
jgi:hypothetical protein